MTVDYPPELVDSFTRLAEAVGRAASVADTYEVLCRGAVEVVDGCDHASLMLLADGRGRTAAASDDVARRGDAIELELGDGPCLDALRDDEPDLHLCADLTAPNRWPALASRLVAETPVRGMGGFRLRTAGRHLGALNLFSSTPGALGEESMAQAAVLAAFASVAVTAALHGEEAETMRAGLQSNRTIGTALGLLMQTHDLTDAEAFGVLSRLSQQMNVKLSQLAADVIEQHRQGIAPPV
ncbi:GAF and ANTAR domain-containing protein [Nocardioides aurantiacus]|uniref:GAF domain-containing protein n=1 Tax=Nocardioides aurantiacus TaxID=86796 RepID=A0A3N2CPQ7_9ACTN|nr:GAF and ANTAR domain-containing protein [Nocardioides aurantiacus]ROR89408.1 GAF domain-containing protein [Nocardioides aurantiacus]